VTPRPPLLTLLASLIVHGGALSLLFVFASGESRPSALLVDLSEPETVRDEGAPRQERAGSSRAIRRAAAPAAASPSRVTPPSPPSSTAAPPAVASTPSPNPEPAPERDVTPPKPPEPREPEPAVAPAPVREEAPDSAARTSATTSTVEVRPNSVGASAERAGTASDGVGRRSTQGSSAPGESSGAGVALAPAGPPGGEPGSEYGAYLRTFRRRIVESLRYPAAARRQGLKGTVQLEIFIKPDGAISAVSITGSSSHPLLDEAALQAVRSLAPQPFPAGLVPRLLRVRLPVVFDLQ